MGVENILRFQTVSENVGLSLGKNICNCMNSPFPLERIIHLIQMLIYFFVQK